MPSQSRPRDIVEDVGKSGVALPMIGRVFRSSRVTPVVCCACTDSAACFTNDEDDSDFCSMASDMLRFLRIGFLTPLTKDPDLDKRLTGSEFCCEQKRFEAGCMGPYSHVTSTSFSLRGWLVVVKRMKNLEAGCTDGDDRRPMTGVQIEEIATHQFNVSGDTVFSLNCDLAHVLHEAFSSLDRSP